MTRQIILDTETTGLDPKDGHRLIEVGCVEMVERCLTGNNFHMYLQPDRDIDAEAEAVHGISSAFLADKPRFADIAEDLIAYLEGAELIIHNAPFDLGFLDHELGRLGDRFKRVADYCSVIDTLVMARKMFPGQRNSLDALCKRYSIDNGHRTLHGALLDSEILADVYLAMTGGQVSLSLEARHEGAGADEDWQEGTVRRVRIDTSGLPVLQANEEELLAHAERLAAIEQAGGKCLWSTG